MSTVASVNGLRSNAELTVYCHSVESHVDILSMNKDSQKDSQRSASVRTTGNARTP